MLRISSRRPAIGFVFSFTAENAVNAESLLLSLFIIPLALYTFLSPSDPGGLSGKTEIGFVLQNDMTG